MFDTAKRAIVYSLSELADETDFGVQQVAVLRLYGVLHVFNECSYIVCGGFAQIHDDIGVDMRDLGVAYPEPFESGAIDEPAGANAFNFPEDGACAGVHVEPGVT